MRSMTVYYLQLIITVIAKPQCVKTDPQILSWCGLALMFTSLELTNGSYPRSL